MEHKKTTFIAVDAMGADGGVRVIVEGCMKALQSGLDIKLRLVGGEVLIKDALARYQGGYDASRIEVHHAQGVVTMEDKPAQIVRRGRDTSMWVSVAAVKNGECDAALSAGNTGALMAMSVLQLRMIEGVDRPAISAFWPNSRGASVVLDVGANVEASAEQLVQFAIMGEAYFRALTGKTRPTVGLLNVGSEELKGHGMIRLAAQMLRVADQEMAFTGFVEGNDIPKGSVDVVVTDGFTGNVALKSAEGTARLVGSWVKDALTESWMTRLGALVMMASLKKLKARMNPSNINGAPLLGLNGLVLKSHGGTDADGIVSALRNVDSLARQPFQEEIKATIAKVAERVARSSDMKSLRVPPESTEKVVI